MATMSNAAQASQPIYSTPIRWTLRVLAWLAFGISAYLAWKAVTQTSVAGCGVGDNNGCDIVLGSIWSKWIVIPIAVIGLACYASLAGLSVLLGLHNAPSSRWIHTAFVMLAVIAAGASLWFLAVQVFAIRALCRFCIITDLCGIALGALALWSTITWLNATRYTRSAHNAAPGLMALRSALPTGARSAPIARPISPPKPSLSIALGGAGAALAMLIGGQILLPAKNFEVQQAALDKPMALVGSKGTGDADVAPTLDAETRVAMRVPPEPSDNGKNESTADSNEKQDSEENGGSAEDAPSDPPSLSDTGPQLERLVKFLGGNLTLDVYKHPLLGSPEAPNVIVEMVSYDCPHCRKMHKTMKRALARYGGQVAMIVMVVPLETSCNKLITDPAGSHPGACSTARMALGVATLNPKAFPRFHDWLMADEEKPPSRDRIIARAYGLADRSRLRELSGSEELRKQVAEYVDLFARLTNRESGKKSFGLPVQILGDHVMSGSVEKASDVYKAWEEHLGVKPN